MFPRVARASLLDSLRFNLFHVVPMALQGVFKKRPFWVRFFGALHPDPLGRRFVARLRAKYHTPFVDLRMLGRRTRLVLDVDEMRQVLEHSPDAYADPKSKRDGMSVFQPNAVTISRLPPWAVRRWFNATVLAAGVSAPLDEHFVRVVREEVARWFARSPTRLVWADLQELFDRLTLRVVFGDRAAEDRTILNALDTLMGAANRVLFRRRPPGAFETLDSGIRRYLAAPDPNSLIGVAAQLLRAPERWPDGAVPPPEVVRAENQVPHWLFAMKDTLAANTAFTLALLATHPAIRDRAWMPPRERPTLATDLHGAYLLEGCVQEAMRLWPTTPMLLREATCAGVLGDVHGPGLQVLIWNAANHRDASVVPQADRFDPERWARGEPNWQMNHLSNGRQGCAGKSLALFLAKVVVAEMLGRVTIVLQRPTIAPNEPLPETFDWFAFTANTTLHPSGTAGPP
jgi:cytochrome P450